MSAKSGSPTSEIVTAPQTEGQGSAQPARVPEWVIKKVMDKYAADLMKGIDFEPGMSEEEKQKLRETIIEKAKTFVKVIFDADHILIGGSTYTFKEELKKMGFEWDSVDEVWRKEVKADEVDEMFKIASKYATKIVIEPPIPPVIKYYTDERKEVCRKIEEIGRKVGVENEMGQIVVDIEKLKEVLE